MTAPLTGTTSNGVPYLAVPPASDAATAPVIILWHLMDAPRSEAAFAAALPLDGLDAWKVYLGLPTFGTRSLPGGVDEVMRLLAKAHRIVPFEELAFVSAVVARQDPWHGRSQTAFATHQASGLGPRQGGR